MKKGFLAFVVAILILVIIIGLIVDPPAIKNVYKSETKNQYIVELVAGEVIVEHVEDAWPEKPYYKFKKSDDYDVLNYDYDNDKIIGINYKIKIGDKIYTVSGGTILQYINSL